MKVIGFLAVSALGALADYDIVSITSVAGGDYTWNEAKDYQSAGDNGGDLLFWKKEAGNTGLDCANRCEAIVGCAGFTLQYEDNDQTKTSKCVGKMSNPDGDGLIDPAAYLRPGSGFYERSKAVEVAAPFETMKGANLESEEIPDGYAGLDHLNCESQEQGADAYKFDKMQIGRDIKPGIAKCAKLCDAMMGCQAFSMSFDGDYAGRCVGYSGPTEGGNAYGCNVGTGKPDEALFLRLAGKVTEPACAPAGTDNKKFNICDSAAGGDSESPAFSGAPVTSASVSALLLAPLVAVLLA